MTKVKFVIFKSELLALFPDLHEENNSVSCYARLGQHGIADRSLLRYKAATKEEYADLLKELVAIGYDDLKIMNKW